jgi:hypothetical protein
MRSGSFCLLVAAVLLAAACATPVPVEREAFIGAWDGPGLLLVITPEGWMYYRRVKPRSSSTYRGPVKDLTDDAIVGSAFFFRVRLPVDTVPYYDGSRWRMVLDGVALVKSDRPAVLPADD